MSCRERQSERGTHSIRRDAGAFRDAMHSGAFPVRRSIAANERATMNHRSRMRTRTAAQFEPNVHLRLLPSLPSLAGETHSGHWTITGASSHFPVMPLPHRMHGGVRTPERSSRFVLRRHSAAGAERLAAELLGTVQRSEQRRYTVRNERERIDGELGEMLAVLQEVEEAGTQLYELPPERLRRIQQVLRGGIRSHSGRGFLLPPLEGSRPGSSDSPSDALGVYSAAGVAGSQQHMPRGLEEHEINRLRVSVARGTPTRPRDGGSDSLTSTSKLGACDDESSDVCAVCISEMVQGESVCTLACKHCYHHECIVRWLRLSIVCPLCKAHALGWSKEKTAAHTA